MKQARKFANLAWLIGMMLGGSTLATTVVPLSPEQVELNTQMHEWQSAAADGLIEDASADALFTAAMLLSRPTGSFLEPEADQKVAWQDLAQRRLRLLNRAAKLDPQSAEIAATAMHVCRSLDACDIGTYAERLHQAEPDGAAWLMPALHVASEQQDSETITQIVQQMGEASVFDNYYGASVRRIYRALAGASLPPMTTMMADELHEWDLTAQDTVPLLASTSATINFTMIATPNYSELVQACKPDRPEFETRRSACRAIGKTMTHASSIIDNQIGLALRRFAATGDADTLAVLHAETRTRDWVMNAFMQTDQVNDPVAYQRAMLKYGSEAKARAAMVADAGLPVTPPVGWVSPRAMHIARQAEAQAQAQSQSEPAMGACHAPDDATEP